MALTLTEYIARTAQLLMDTGAAIWPTATLTEAIRLALQEYSFAYPQRTETVIVLPGDGHEIALDALTGLISVTQVWWPYDSTADEVWPPYRVAGWRLTWDNGQPVLILDSDEEDQPEQDDEVRIWYSLLQTIQDLDSASATTVPSAHDSILVTGAAGYACLARAADLVETAAQQMTATPNLAALGERYLSRFRKSLDALRRRTEGPAWPDRGWKLDKWDSEYSSG